MGQFPPIEPYDAGMLVVGDGHHIYWECCGNPAGKPALFLHGGPGTGVDAYAIMLEDADDLHGRADRQPAQDVEMSTWRRQMPHELGGANRHCTTTLW